MDGGGGGGGGEEGTGVANVHFVNGSNNNNENDTDLLHNAIRRATTSDAVATETTRPHNPLKRKSTSSVTTLNQSAVDATNVTANAFIGGRHNRAWRSWMDPCNRQENGTAFNTQSRPPPQPRTQTQTRVRPEPTPVSIPIPSPTTPTLTPPLQSRTQASQPDASTLSARPMVSPSMIHNIQDPIRPQHVLPAEHVAQQQSLRQQGQQQQRNAQREFRTTMEQQRHLQQLQSHTRIAQPQHQAQQAIPFQQLQHLQLQKNLMYTRMFREQHNRQLQARGEGQITPNQRVDQVRSNAQLPSPIHGNFSSHMKVVPIQVPYRNPAQGIHTNQSIPPSQNPRQIRPQSISGPQMRGVSIPGPSHPQSPVGPRPGAPEHRLSSMSDTTQRHGLRPEFSYVLTDTGSSIPGHKVVMDHHLLPPALIHSQKVPEGETLFMAIKGHAYLNLSVTPNIFHTCKFQVTDPSRIAGSRTVAPQPGKPPRIRIIDEGSLTYRIRFVNILKTLTEPDLSTWGCMETKHPPCAFAEINGQILDFRKKKNWGRDLPTDITDHIQQGVNEVKFAVFEDRAQRDASQESIVFCIEILEAISRTTIHQHCLTKQLIPTNDAKIKIRERIKPSQSNDDDDDDLVTVGSDTMILDIQCPISKTTLKVPVRSKHCSHIECFDLDSYLSSRPKYAGGVAVTDAWSCPICGPISDCRPQNLVTDGFIKEAIRRIIADKGEQHGVDRIIVRSDGLWKVYVPDLDTNQTEGRKKHEVIDLLDDD